MEAIRGSIRGDQRVLVVPPFLLDGYVSVDGACMREKPTCLGSVGASNTSRDQPDTPSRCVFLNIFTSARVRVCVCVKHWCQFRH